MNESSQFLSRWVFLRLLGAIYLIAFVSLWVQVDGLLGSGGILPARARFPREQNVGERRARHKPIPGPGPGNDTGAHVSRPESPFGSGLYPAFRLAPHNVGNHRHAGFAVVQAGNGGEVFSTVMVKTLRILADDFLQRLETIRGASPPGVLTQQRSNLFFFTFPFWHPILFRGPTHGLHE